MALVFGMDEAGYGPNLGPLVVTVTAWEVPGAPHEFDFWNGLSPIVASPDNRKQALKRILVGDSKAVYSSARGIHALEQSVLTILSSLGDSPGHFQDLCSNLRTTNADFTSEPWYEDHLPIPCGKSVNETLAAEWQTTCESAGVRFRGIACDLVLTQRYNQTVRQFGSKGVALSRISLALLRQLWDPEENSPTLIIADKHGGRNRYDELLAEVLDGQFIIRMEEGTSRSRYKVGQTEICFQTKAESHFPVAVASMVSKYLRELAMMCFNRFWQSHQPDLKPTKGYPVDAARFRKDIAEVQQQLGISDEILWRER